MPKRKPGSKHAVQTAKDHRSETNEKRKRQRVRRAHFRMFEFMAGWR